MAALFHLHRNPALPIEEVTIPTTELQLAIEWLAHPLADSHREIVSSLTPPLSVAGQLTRLQLTDTEQRILHRIIERPGICRRELQRSLSGVMANERDSALTELFLRNLVRADSGGRLFRA